MPSGLERRYVSPRGMSVESRGEADARKDVVVGFAANFGTRSENLGGFVETIQPNFFRKALADLRKSTEEHDCYSLFNHDPNEVLARTGNGELVLREEEKGDPHGGLWQETELKGDTQASRDMLANVKANRIYKMSFAFRIAWDGEEWKTEGNTNLRILVPDGCERLYDVSPVTYPAYNSTTLGMRSMAQQMPEFERGMVALVRCEKKLPATKEDVQSLRELIARIEKALPAEETDKDARALSAMRARIALALGS